MSDDLKPKIAFTEALVAFQSEMPHVGKDQKANTGTYSYAYSDLTTVQQAALPVLTKNGLAFEARPTLREDGSFVLRYSLLHVGGHERGGDYPLPEKATPQQVGSAVTYGRRYCFCAVTGIAPGGEDDDGARANDAPIAVRDPGRTRGKTTRTKPDGPTDDPWTAPLERTTDADWFADIQARLDLCGTPGEVRGLIDEARGKWTEGRLSDDDAKTWKAATTARMNELGAA